jgi:hypothetical protein
MTASYKFSLYGSFTIKEATSVGNKFKARCKANYGYERDLTIGSLYEIETTPRILPMTPLCKLVGDSGREIECHLERFEKEELVDAEPKQTQTLH